MNNSSTGGTIFPAPTIPVLNPAQPQITLVQFLQILFASLSELPGTLVRPMWQPEEPKEPDIIVNWAAFGITDITPDANAYQAQQGSSLTNLQRQELINVSFQVYGPQAMNIMTLVRDGLQIPQNIAGLEIANMAFAYDTPARHLPDLVNGRWNDRYVTEFFFRRYVVRTYPILSFISANGIIYTQTAVNENYQTTFQTGS